MRFFAIAGLCFLVAAAALVSGASPKGATFLGTVLKPQLATDGDHKIDLVPQGSHPTLITGSSDDSMHLVHRKRITPSLIVSVAEGSISKVVLDYGDNAFAVPPGNLILRDHRGERVLFQTSLPATVKGDTKSIDIAIPDALKVTGDFPSETFVELSLVHQEVTTFTYTFEHGIPDDIFSSGQTYDLTPHNATMMTKFMIRVSKKPSPKMSVWLSRKPSAPDFRLMVYLNGDLFAESDVERDPTSSDALGFDVDIEDDVHSFVKGRVEFVAHYYELHREATATVAIDNLRKTIDRLQRGDAALNSEVFATDTRTSIRLSHHQGTNFVGLKILQGAPMQDVQLSLYRIEADGTRTLFLRESDDVIPYYADQESQVQYGWDDAIPAKVEEMQTDEGADFLDGPVEIVVAYNNGNAADFGIGRVLERWLRSNGGMLKHLNLDFLDKPNHSFESKHPLTSRANLKSGELIAKIPYSTLVTSTIVERSAWSEVLRNHSDAHRRHVESAAIHPQAEKIMMLTVAVYMHLFDESMNYRPYFHSYSTSGQKLAVFFSDEENDLFSFDKQVSTELQRMRTLWDVEFKVLQKVGDKLPRQMDKEAYYRVRSQVETRLLNLTDQLVLVPIVDLLTHNDAPNCRVEYDDDNHFVVVTATTDIAAGSPLTIDFGEGQKTGLDFLIQFGFVPEAAVKAASLETPKGPVYLTETDASYAEVKAAFADAESAKEAIQKATAVINAANIPPARHASATLRAAAERLLQHERTVLQLRSKSL